MYYNSIIETIGNTPLVKLNKVNKGIPGTILVKVEYFNPGNSMKDRMAIKMVEDAEKEGKLKPGGTIIEGTSGNTGMGLALAAISKGYKCVFTLADKQSKEKMDILRAMGAEVIVCPTNVSPDDPRSYYSVAKKIHEETPNSIYPNQYDNMSNSRAHYETTGPEIWEQTEGKITHWAAGVGTGGSMCGTSRYLKDQNPEIRSIGIDSYGSVFKKYKETGKFDEKEIYPYLTEGIGEDILPKNVDFAMIDHFVKVTDKDGAIMTRRLAREEGLFCGWSCGSAVHGALEYAEENMKEDDVMVIILPDHGTRYLGKIYNDDWMKDHGFIENNDYATAKNIIKKRSSSYKLISIESDQKIGEVVKLLDELSISQLPITKSGEFVGSISDTQLLNKLVENPELKAKPISEIMDNPFKFIALNTTVDTISSMMNHGDKALMVLDDKNDAHIITKQDLLMAFAD
ncbi:cystathionine beta-synthase [Marivirga salinae]|uniref:Cystathionine beta-synthase n=1 Tax=Marivirga salinarum TaxID=3059078 RepID=A0AA51R8J8_9BACT|nr:cystathionine beta-synthase [Marivirga sp. BDSF4-3]WMN11282.1 cystathionine beta-synthase [Marivirga sp. BDSF4-3]